MDGSLYVQCHMTMNLLHQCVFRSNRSKCVIQVLSNEKTECWIHETSSDIHSVQVAANFSVIVSSGKQRETNFAWLVNVAQVRTGFVPSTSM